MMRLAGSGASATRQAINEPRAAPAHGRAFRLDAAAHRLDEALGDGKAKPDARLAAVGSAALIELLEDALEVGSA